MTKLKHIFVCFVYFHNFDKNIKKQVATKGYSKVLTDSALQVNFFIHLHFFLKNAKSKVLSRPKPSVNMLRIHSGNTDGVNTSEIIIVTLRDLIYTPNCGASTKS